MAICWRVSPRPLIHPRSLNAAFFVGFLCKTHRQCASEEAFMADLGGMKVTLMRLMKEIPWPSATIVLVCYLFRVF